MTPPIKVTVNDQMSRGLATCSCGMQVQCQYSHCLLWKGGGREKGRKSREEKEEQEKAMGRKRLKEEDESEEKRLVKLKAPGLFFLFPESHLGPVSLEIPEYCCLSLGGRREGGQIFTDEDPLKGEVQSLEVWQVEGRILS